jgi:hypothetical protein
MAQPSSTVYYSQAPSVVFLPKYGRPNFIPLKANNQFWSIMLLNRKWGKKKHILDKIVTGIS